MLRYLHDPANIITGVGHVICAGSLYLTVSGRPELGTALILWAWIADHLDGLVARRMQGRRSAEAAALGKSFDGFADLVHGVVFPSVSLIVLSSASLLALVATVALVFLGAYRLSYFDSFGLSDGRFTGIPVSYNVPLLAVLLLGRPLLPPDAFAAIANCAFIALALLHVSSLQVPPIRGKMIAGASVFAIGASAMLSVGI